MFNYVTYHTNQSHDGITLVENLLGWGTQDTGNNITVYWPKGTENSANRTTDLFNDKAVNEWGYSVNHFKEKQEQVTDVCST